MNCFNQIWGPQNVCKGFQLFLAHSDLPCMLFGSWLLAQCAWSSYIPVPVEFHGGISVGSLQPDSEALLISSPLTLERYAPKNTFVSVQFRGIGQVELIRSYLTEPHWMLEVCPSWWKDRCICPVQWYTSDLAGCSVASLIRSEKNAPRCICPFPWHRSGCILANIASLNLGSVLQVDSRVCPTPWHR